MKLNRSFSSAGIALAMAFIISCSDDSGDDGRIHYGMKKEQFYDERDGKKYAYVKIGTQNWMAENLNYEITGSRCYGDETGGDSLSNCDTYGRLYKWADALEICPKGWHLPSGKDWDILMNYVQTDNDSSYAPNSNASIAGKYLTATSGWAVSAINEFNSEDKYGFAALPGGYAGYGSGNIVGGKGSFKDITKSGYWWSSAEFNEVKAYCRRISGNAANWSHEFKKSSMYSVRCVQD